MTAAAAVHGCANVDAAARRLRRVILRARRVAAVDLLVRDPAGRPIMRVALGMRDARDVSRHVTRAAPATAVPGRRVPDAAAVDPVEIVGEEDRLVVVGEDLDTGADLDEVAVAVVSAGIL